MDFELTDEQRLLRDTVRDFANQEVKPVAEELDRTKAFPYELVAKMGELGLMGIPFPEQYGGGGADTLAYALAVEELTRIDSSVAITMAAHTSLGTMPIYLWGTDEQKDDWLPQLCSGQKLAAFGLTEPEAGSDAGNTHTRAALDGRRVGRERRQAVHHQLGDRHLGLRDDHGGHRPGERQQGDLQHHRPERDPGLRGRRAVPEDGLERLGHPPALLRRLPRPGGQPARAAAASGFKQFLEILDGGRIGVAAMGVGLAQGALDEAISYAKERQAFGQPIGKFQAIQAKIADLSAQIEAARLLVYRAAIDKDRGESIHADRRTGQADHRAGSRSAPPRRPSRSTAATATSRNTPSAASIATRRSSPSARAPTRCSRW